MDLERIDRPAPLPPRPHDGNKGTFGRLLIVGGNDEMIGAPVLAGMAALRTGAGLVQIALPRSVLAAALSICPELIGMGLTGNANQKLLETARKADAMVVGPGLGQSAAARKRLLALTGLDKAMVVDADGLNLLAGMKKWPASQFKARAVLTPHPGEMRRLAGLLLKKEAGAWNEPKTSIPADETSRIDVAMHAARRFGQVLVLKGHRTVVTDGQRVYINQTGDSTLAKAGTGDILSGVLGCLLAQGMGGFEAATLGVWLHGRAGELAGERYGKRSALGREVIDALPQAIAEQGT
jgi:NAD(P)H-hydrate epimerase